MSLDLIVLGLPVHDPAWIAAVGGLITACGGVAGGAIGALGAMLHGRKHTDAKLEVIKGLAAEALTITGQTCATTWTRPARKSTRFQSSQPARTASCVSWEVRLRGSDGI